MIKPDPVEGVLDGSEVSGDGISQGGQDLGPELAQREGNHELAWDEIGLGCLGGITNRC